LYVGQVPQILKIFEVISALQRVKIAMDVPELKLRINTVNT